MGFNYFPQEMIDLQVELAKHPPAMEHMASCTSQYLEDRLAHLCTYCDIVVDDSFDIDELCELASLITKKLYEKRTGLCITH
jgi:hypothetical protein